MSTSHPTLPGSGTPPAERSRAASSGPSAAGESEPGAPSCVATPSPPFEAGELADGVARPLDPRSIALGRVQGTIATTIVFCATVVATIAFSVASRRWDLGLWLAAGSAAVTALVAWSALRWPEIRYRHASYVVDARGIEIRRGVVWRTAITVPRSRVQHTDVSQGPLERSYGLGRLLIYTAGSHYARVELHGLDHQAALRIRDHLLPRGTGDAI